MRTRIEELMLWCGTVAAAWMTILARFHEALGRSVVEAFRGGSAGGIVLGVALAVGGLGLIFFLINIFSGARAHWPRRLTACLAFLVAAAIAAGQY